MKSLLIHDKSKKNENVVPLVESDDKSGHADLPSHTYKSVNSQQQGSSTLIAKKLITNQSKTKDAE
ncbi:hypothetical protein FQR65_LT07759 [Abscondita terminalis]|nr:hypothetical protein FQR65_LT07759 [Abscondita terminalis]